MNGIEKISNRLVADAEAEIGWLVDIISEVRSVRTEMNVPFSKKTHVYLITEFKKGFENAEAVFCNSLHGTCLSILFHREFFAFGIEGGGRKYEDLCGKLGLEGRFCRDAVPDAAPIDWARVDARREELRAESLAWLDEAVRGAWALRQERLSRAGTP